MKNYLINLLAIKTRMVVIIIIIENNDQFYRDNFINDQIVFPSMFPKPPARVKRLIRARRERASDDFLIRPDYCERGK